MVGTAGESGGREKVGRGGISFAVSERGERR
jgi:hypothetical protein